MLFAYVTCFVCVSTVSAATGALILFGAVQLTMFAAGWHAGERFAATGWAGFGAALGGLVYLVSPGRAPTPRGAALMTAAGIAWVSIRSVAAGPSIRSRPPRATSARRAAGTRAERRARRPPARHAGRPRTRRAFRCADVGPRLRGLVCRAAALTAMRAAAVQLSVPPIAACGAVLLLSEQPTWRLALASAAILGGVATVLATRARRAAARGDARQARHPTHSSGAKPAHGYRARVLDETANRAPAA